MESDEQHKRKSISYDEEFKNQNISNGKSIHKTKINSIKYNSYTNYNSLPLSAYKDYFKRCIKYGDKRKNYSNKNDDLNNIYLKCRNKYQSYVTDKKYSHGLKLHGTKIFERLPLDIFNDNYILNTSNISKELQNKALEYFFPFHENPCFQKEEECRKIKLTPIPYKNINLINDETEKNNIMAAKRSAVLMRRVEYTHLIKNNNLKKINNNYEYNKNLMNITNKLCFLKGAVLIIEDWWKKMKIYNSNKKKSASSSSNKVKKFKKFKYELFNDNNMGNYFNIRKNPSIMDFYTTNNNTDKLHKKINYNILQGNGLFKSNSVKGLNKFKFIRDRIIDNFNDKNKTKDINTESNICNVSNINPNTYNNKNIKDKNNNALIYSNNINNSTSINSKAQYPMNKVDQKDNESKDDHSDLSQNNLIKDNLNKNISNKNQNILLISQKPKTYTSITKSKIAKKIKDNNKNDQNKKKGNYVYMSCGNTKKSSKKLLINNNKPETKKNKINDSNKSYKNFYKNKIKNDNREFVNESINADLIRKIIKEAKQNTNKMNKNRSNDKNEDKNMDNNLNNNNLMNRYNFPLKKESRNKNIIPLIKSNQTTKKMKSNQSTELIFGFNDIEKLNQSICKIKPSEKKASKAKCTNEKKNNEKKIIIKEMKPIQYIKKNIYISKDNNNNKDNPNNIEEKVIDKKNKFKEKNIKNLDKIINNKIPDQNILHQITNYDIDRKGSFDKDNYKISNGNISQSVCIKDDVNLGKIKEQNYYNTENFEIYEGLSKLDSSGKNTAKKEITKYNESKENEIIVDENEQSINNNNNNDININGNNDENNDWNNYNEGKIINTNEKENENEVDMNKIENNGDLNNSLSYVEENNTKNKINVDSYENINISNGKNFDDNDNNENEKNYNDLNEQSNFINYNINNGKDIIENENNNNNGMDERMIIEPNEDKNDDNININIGNNFEENYNSNIDNDNNDNNIQENELNNNSFNNHSNINNQENMDNDLLNDNLKI